MQNYSLPDEAATVALGAALARTIQPGVVIHLEGDLGAGKTTMTRALLRAAGHAGKVKSPTYTLVEPYEICLQGRVVRVLHFDLYRMQDAAEFVEAGFLDDFTPEAICIVEWPCKAAGLLPAADIHIALSVDGAGRVAVCRAESVLGQVCMEQLRCS